MPATAPRSDWVLDDPSPALPSFGRYRYRAFGARTDINGIAPARQDPSFQNRTFDAGLGIYDYRNRSFDPATGRFLQRDPVMGGDPMYNPYCFPGNNPVSTMDPLGLGQAPDGPKVTPTPPPTPVPVAPAPSPYINSSVGKSSIVLEDLSEDPIVKRVQRQFYARLVAQDSGWWVGTNRAGHRACIRKPQTKVVEFTAAEFDAALNQAYLDNDKAVFRYVDGKKGGGGWRGVFAATDNPDGTVRTVADMLPPRPLRTGVAFLGETGKIPIIRFVTPAVLAVLRMEENPRRLTEVPDKAVIRRSEKQLVAAWAPDLVDAPLSDGDPLKGEQKKLWSQAYLRLGPEDRAFFDKWQLYAELQIEGTDLNGSRRTVSYPATQKLYSEEGKAVTGGLGAWGWAGLDTRLISGGCVRLTVHSPLFPGEYQVVQEQSFAVTD